MHPHLPLTSSSFVYIASSIFLFFYVLLLPPLACYGAKGSSIFWVLDCCRFHFFQKRLKSIAVEGALSTPSRPQFVRKSYAECGVSGTTDSRYTYKHTFETHVTKLLLQNEAAYVVETKSCTGRSRIGIRVFLVSRSWCRQKSDGRNIGFLVRRIFWKLLCLYCYFLSTFMLRYFLLLFLARSPRCLTPALPRNVLLEFTEYLLSLQSPGNVMNLSDSRGALLQLQNTDPGTRLTLEVSNTFRDFKEAGWNVSLQWGSFHCEYPGMNTLTHWLRP